MKIFHELRSALMATLILTIVGGGLYPLAVFVLAQLLFYNQANGSLIVDAKGIVLGSQLIAQSFTSDTYFHPRPSAAGHSDAPLSSGGSNPAPTAKKPAAAKPKKPAAVAKAKAPRRPKAAAAE